MKKFSLYLSLVLLVACVVGARGNALGDLFGKLIGNNLKSSDANDCAGCTVVVALLEQYAQVHNQSIDNVVGGVCDILPAYFKPTCIELVDVYGAAIIKLINERETADAVCLHIGLCANATCHLFPLPKSQRPPLGIKIEIPAEKRNLQSFQWPWELVANHLPAVDLDHDKFSTVETLRGTHWRGKDCEDMISNVYPGRNINDYGAKVDHNCNGIYGVDPTTKKDWEELLCSDTQQFGYAVLGDSAAAHFHIPPQWMTASEINNQTYSDLLEILEDELDWPEMSASSGYMNETWSGHPVGPVDSMYVRLRERNLCMHRDYQNIGVNGARSGAMNSSIVNTLARNQKYDHPLLATYALIGNDVCNGHFGTSHMTTPPEFYANVVGALNYLDTVLPPGSHVTFMGLVDGRILYDSMATRIHPIGSTNKDVTYSNFYDYLNCLQISPCFGWMNTDAYWRNATTARAEELNQVYGDIIKNHTYANFDMTYLDCPMEQVISLWESMGGQSWEIIEPVDGFHPNQIANALLAEVTYNLLMANFSYLIPPINPNNQKIAQQFGTQGGY